MGIKSGDILAAFNRIRSQTVSTRFVGLHHNNLTGLSQLNWQVSVTNVKAWRIWSLVDYVTVSGRYPAPYSGKVLDPANNFDVIPSRLVQESRAYIMYGQVVVLEHLATGICTTKLICRPVIDRTTVAISNPTSQIIPCPGQPQFHSSLELVSQLHKVAFQIADSPGCFLKVNEDAIDVFRSQRQSYEMMEALFDTRTQGDGEPFEHSDSFKKANYIRFEPGGQSGTESIDELCAFSLVGIGILFSR
jgi:Beta-trefoil DNA-binding domain